MKKIVCILLAMALCLGMLSGCGNKAKTEEEPVINSAAESAPVVAEDPAAAALNGQTQEVPENVTVQAPVVRGTALTMNGKEYSVEMCQIFFVSIYFEFLEQYGSYASMYGLDTSKGIPGLVDQPCTYSEDGTWYGYFLESTLYRMQQAAAMCDYAKANGIGFTEEEIKSMDTMMEAMEAAGLQEGFTDADDYLSSYYGEGVTAALYREYAEMMNLANKAYSEYYRSLEFTDEELDAHFLEMGYNEDQYQYRLTSMRHLLIMAEPNEDGEYTDEAIQKAHDEVQALYDEWLQGDKTEESFAEMANMYSADGGSNTRGGLYTEIYEGQMIPGINSWLFEEEREVGDTVIVDNNGSYTGSHIVYFVGYGDVHARIIAKDDLMQATLSEWITGLMADYEPIPGIAYQSIGLAY